MKKITLIYIGFVSFFFLEITHAQSSSMADGWLLTATDRTAQYAGVTLSNGRIGLVVDQSPLKVNATILNGVYELGPDNGLGQGQGISRIVKGIDFLNLEITIDGTRITDDNISDWRQELNMREATFTTTFSFQGKAKVSYTLLALRNMPYSAMAMVDITPLQNIDVEVNNRMYVNEQLRDSKMFFRVLKDNEHLLPIHRTEAKTLYGKHTISAATTFLFKEKEFKQRKKEDAVGFEGSLPKGELFSFALMGGICTTQDFNDPINESERQPIFGITNGIDKLFLKHKQAWARLWENDIVIEGDLESQRDVRFALYNLFSFSKKGSRLSIPPMGLTSQGYNGHVFWDTELWMYPPLLVLEPEIARAALDYRYDRLPQAKHKASVYGYEGAMYPWESDDTGEESTPTWALTGAIEHHITGDIGVAFWNYYVVTGDKEWLRKEGWYVLKETADFWASRVVKNADGSYSIENVVGADEYAQNVDDNAFTNGVAIENLRNAIKAARELGYTPSPRWKEVAEGIVIHTKDGITQDYKGYGGQIIKQGDVNLLAYPLHIITDKEQIKRDLDYYIHKVDEKDGPAMAHGIFSTLYARMGDVEKAYELFKKSYIPNKRPPFGVLSESARSNNPYFATGAGAMLQAVIFGFGGVEITDQGLKQNEVRLPKEWTSLMIKGLAVKK